MSKFQFAANAAAIAAFAFSLSGCGGDGGEPRVVVSAFTYPSTSVDVRANVSVSPQVTGIGGAVPTCTVVSGALPPGITIGESCVLAGAPTAAGSYTATVHMTGAGIDSAPDATADFVITDPTPSLTKLNSGAGGVADFTFAPEAVISDLTVVQVSVPTTVAGDTIDYSIVAGALPSGITLDSSTGHLSGAPTALGTFTPAIVATLHRGGIAYASNQVIVVLSVQPSALTLSIASPVCVAPIDVTVVCNAPTTNFVPVTGATLAFSASNLPASMSIDAVTGVVSGVPPDWTLNGSLVGASINITALATYPDGTTATASAILKASGNPPWPQYGSGVGFVTAISATGIPSNDSLALRGYVHAGVPFTAVVTGVTDGLAGDVYAYSLVSSSDPSFTIDPLTGTVSGTAPATPTVFDFSVLTTTTRQGKTYTWRNDIALGTE